MDAGLDKKRIGIFLAFAFGIAWLTGLVIYLTGGLVNSPKLGGGLNLAVVLLAGPYMWAPALANIFTRLITREGWKDVGLRLNFRKGWRMWLVAWFAPGVLTILGAVIYFMLFPAHFDPALKAVQALLAKQGAGSAITPWTLVALQIAQAFIISPLVNSFFTFGEEFGWRAYLQPKLFGLGARKMLLLMGVIWGVWHWPVIFMGYEYGFDYPGYPWLGPLLFCWITFSFGTLLAWVTFQGKSVWPAVIGHAAINGIAAVSTLALVGNPNLLIGPLPVGVIGSLGYATVALVLFFNRAAWRDEAAYFQGGKLRNDINIQKELEI